MFEFYDKIKSFLNLNGQNSSTDLYEILSKDSLKATSMDHGLQTNAIYWETGHRTWISFFQPFCHKFTTKLIDDQIRKFFRFTSPITDTSFIFYDDQQRFRFYEGDSDCSIPISISKTPVFSFQPVGSFNPLE